MFLCGLLCAVTLAAFWPVLSNEFIIYDDGQYVTENPHVLSGLNWANVCWALQSGHASNWHPLTWVSHMLDVQLFGLKPGWHHLTNLLLHTANTVLLFLLLVRLTGGLGRSAFVAALFALHPLHVESVAWVAERKDLLSGFFFMLTLWAYVRYVDSLKSRVQSLKSEIREQEPGVQRSNPEPTHGIRNMEHASRSSYVLSLLFFSLGLMSKPMLVTLPFVLLLLDYWPLGRFRPNKLGDSAQPIATGPGFRDRLEACPTLLREKLPFFLLSAASCVAAFVAQESGGAMDSLDHVPVAARVSNALMAYLSYLEKMLWPSKLAILYLRPNHWPAWHVGLAAFVLLVITLLVLGPGRRLACLTVGWLWFLGMLVPVIGVVQVGNQFMADRYTYLPLIGLFVIVAWGGWALASGRETLPEFRPRPRNRSSEASDSDYEDDEEDDEEKAPTPRLRAQRVVFFAACCVLFAAGIATRRQRSCPSGGTRLRVERLPKNRVGRNARGRLCRGRALQGGNLCRGKSHRVGRFFRTNRIGEQEPPIARTLQNRQSLSRAADGSLARRFCGVAFLRPMRQFDTFDGPHGQLARYASGMSAPGRRYSGGFLAYPASRLS